MEVMTNAKGAGPLTTPHGVRFDISVEQAEFNQYWYSPDSIHMMLDEVRHHATSCAFLSTPSLYFMLIAGDYKSSKNHVNDNITTASGVVSDKLKAESRLFEFDRQWEKEPGFVLYDFHKPDHVPVQYFGAFDYVVADPPFITKDAWKAYIHTAKLLLKPGGKMLLTTVMENHTLLEGLLDAPLFIAPFRPSIAHLTYQYVCFTSYKPTRITSVNPELPPEDPKIAAAIQMANDLRESEEVFRMQFQERNREGEQVLPTTLHQNASTSCPALADVPISSMKWGHVPAGLTVYANGDEMPHPAAATAVSNAEMPPADGGNKDYGDDYRDILALRETLDNFKRHVDLSQKHLDVLLRLQQKRTKQKSQGISVLDTDASFDAGKKNLEETLDSMRKMIDIVEAGEAQVAAAGGGGKNISYIAAMKECVEKYATVAIQKEALNELAADATRKYKSPVFNRMRELLEQLKAIKKGAQVVT